MGRKIEDLTGKRFGKLVVLSRADDRNKQTYWLCKCDCGNTKIVRGSKLKSGEIKACGCMKGRAYKDLVGKRFGMLEVLENVGTNKWGGISYLCKCDCGKELIMTSGHIQNSLSCGCQHGNNFKTHGMGHTRLNYIWSNMKARCQNPNIANYQKYGARGIRACDEWQTFEPFMKWALANGYTDELSIDRIDPNGNYEPDNCRWVDNHVQANNKNSNVFIEFSGEKKTVAEWAVETGINSSTILKRLRSGWDVKDILTKPVRGNAKGH